MVRNPGRSIALNLESGPRVPELKEVLGAMIFAANRPLTVREMRGCLQEVAREVGAHTTVFAGVKEADVRGALEELGLELERRHCGFVLTEVAGGFRLQSEETCGVWLRQLLNLRKTNRLSHPSLETLAIIACRQPITRAEIEGIRGVSVDHVIKMLMELQLVRIVGRSELPGRPFLFGTTQGFLEHFGLKDISSLGAMTGITLQARRPTLEESVAPATDLAESEVTAAMDTETDVADGLEKGESGPEAVTIRKEPVMRDNMDDEDGMVDAFESDDFEEDDVDEDEDDADDDFDDDDLGDDEDDEDDR